MTDEPTALARYMADLDTRGLASMSLTQIIAAAFAAGRQSPHAPKEGAILRLAGGDELRVFGTGAVEFVEVSSNGDVQLGLMPAATPGRVSFLTPSGCVSRSGGVKDAELCGLREAEARQTRW